MMDAPHKSMQAAPDALMTHLDKPILFLATANAARSREFYERVLGLAFVADEPPALVFQVGHSMLRIQKVDRVHEVPYTVLGWTVPDIRRTVHHLCAAGVAFQRYEGMTQDEDGIWLAPSGALVAWFSGSGRTHTIADSVQMIAWKGLNRVTGLFASSSSHATGQAGPRQSVVRFFLSGSSGNGRIPHALLFHTGGTR